jgi:hypothetical protein
VAELVGEVGGKAGIAISNDFAGGAIVWKDMLYVEVSDVGGSGGFATGDENGGFGAVVICDGEDTIKAIRRW